MAQRLEYTVLGLIEDALRTIKASPMNLGGVGGGGGGIGGPPGGFIGQLPQYRVTYDETEAATLATLPSGLNPPSGWSLVDNLNHIRYRIQTLESGGGTSLTVQDYDGNPHITSVNTITFSGAAITNLGGGNVLVAFSGGGGGASDSTYLRLDTTNNPLTDQLQIINNNWGAGGIYAQTIGDAYTADIEQYADDTDAVASPALTVIRAKIGGSPTFNYPIVEIVDSTDANPTGAATLLRASVFGVDRMNLNAKPFSNGVAYEFGTTTDMAVDGKIILLKDAGVNSFWVTGSGWTYDRRGLLVEEAPINGSGYMRKNGGWVLASGSGGTGFGENIFFIDQSGGTADTYHALSGSVDGSNAVFTTSQAKYVSGSLKVYLNGQLQTQGSAEDWVETSPASGTFTFNTAPLTGDLITAEYLVSSVATGNADTLDGLNSTNFARAYSWYEFNDSGEYLEFGLDVGGKVFNAGRMGYNMEGDGYFTVIGAGTSVPNRTTKFLDNVIVDNALSSATMNLTNPSATYNINGTAHTHDDRYASADGWFARSETWTRTGNHTFTVSGDLTLIFRKGAKIRYKDGGSYEYAVVGSSSFAASTTTVNLIVNTDYTMAAATITDRYVSYIANPQGFPAYFNYTATVSSLTGTITSTTVTTALWKVEGTQGYLFVDFTITNNGTGATAVVVTHPLTIFDVSMIGREFTVGIMCYGGTQGGNIYIRKYDETYPGATGRQIKVGGWANLT